MKPVRFDDEAVAELTAAYERYEDEVPALGDALIAAIDESLNWSARQCMGQS